MTLVQVVHDQYGLMTLLRTVPLYNRDSPPFGFRREKAAGMKDEMSSFQALILSWPGWLRTSTDINPRFQTIWVFVGQERIKACLMQTACSYFVTWSRRKFLIQLFHYWFMQKYYFSQVCFHYWGWLLQWGDGQNSRWLSYVSATRSVLMLTAWRSSQG